MVENGASQADDFEDGHSQRWLRGNVNRWHHGYSQRWHGGDVNRRFNHHSFGWKFMGGRWSYGRGRK
jgi:hypothetical protein